MHSNSHFRIINSPYLFEKFQVGEIGNPSDRFIITHEAHPDILLQAKYFWSAPYDTLVFTDEHQSFISISPNLRSAHALFLKGTNFTHGIPHQYVDYSIEFAKEIKITPANLEYIFKWSNAINLRLSGGFNLTQQLNDNWVKFLNFKQLKSISIDIQRDSYMKLRVNTFLIAPTLRLATFNADDITESEFEIFVANQYVPSKTKFNCKVKGTKTYQCQKRLLC